MNKKLIISSILLLILFAATILSINSLNFKLYKPTLNKKAKIGIAVLKDNKIYKVGSKKQPLLSVFKYITALKVLDDVDKNNISLNKKLKITQSMIDKTLYSPMLKKYNKPDFEISIAELLEYMISQSDNNACDILINQFGGIKEIENYIHKIGFKNIEISVNEKEMNEDIEKQYLNKATPEDIVKLIKKGQKGEILSGASTDFLNNIMIKTTTGENKLKAGLPPNTTIGHKTGSSSRKNNIKIADNDAGFIILPNNEIYYIAVFIQDSKMSDEKNADLIKEISKTVFKHFTKQHFIKLHLAK